MRYRTAESKLTLSQLKELKYLDKKCFDAHKEVLDTTSLDVSTPKGYKAYVSAAKKRAKIIAEYDNLRRKYGLRTTEQEEQLSKGKGLYFRFLKDIK